MGLSPAAHDPSVAWAFWPRRGQKPFDGDTSQASLGRRMNGGPIYGRNIVGGEESG